MGTGARLNRGEVWWCDLPAPDGRRPVLILTRSSAIGFLNAVTVAPLTTTIRPSPTFVPLSLADGMFADCAVNCDRLLTIPKRLLSEMIVALHRDRLEEVTVAVQFALGMN